MHVNPQAAVSSKHSPVLCPPRPRDRVSLSVLLCGSSVSLCSCFVCFFFCVCVLISFLGTNSQYNSIQSNWKHFNSSVGPLNIVFVEQKAQFTQHTLKTCYLIQNIKNNLLIGHKADIKLILWLPLGLCSLCAHVPQWAERSHFELQAIGMSVPASFCLWAKKWADRDMRRRESVCGARPWTVSEHWSGKGRAMTALGAKVPSF